jgi:hypothetical protein
MPRTPEAESFFIAVYQAVQAIPHGRVTTYGHIATLIGTRESIPAFVSSLRVSRDLVGRPLRESATGAHATASGAHSHMMGVVGLGGMPAVFCAV